MLGLSIKISGKESIEENLSSLINDEKIDDLLERAAIEINNQAKILCPVDTGNLRNSITYVKIMSGLWGVGTNVEYAPYVEFGTYKMRAQPYLRPAFEAVKSKISIAGKVMVG